MKYLDTKSKIYIGIIVAIIILIFLSACIGDELPDSARVYECDYVVTSVTKTKIKTTIDTNPVTITGNVLAMFTDPLTMKDSDGKKLAYAGDTYGIIAQDSHGIYVDDKFEVNMVGKFEFVGESYDIEDSDGNIVAKLDFNSFGTNGSLIDKNGNIIATYSSAPFAYDYTVKIIDNDVCSDTAILMMIASYVSDYVADAAASNN